MSSNPYMIMFGVTEILLSTIKDFHQIWWLSTVAAIMSFTYSSIGLALGIIQVAGNNKKSNHMAVTEWHSELGNVLNATDSKFIT